MNIFQEHATIQRYIHAKDLHQKITTSFDVNFLPSSQGERPDHKDHERCYLLPSLAPLHAFTHHNRKNDQHKKVYI